eukprot:CAMPEP_0184671822 /NCGR_PEP_ID=MMETSP0308-20130426/85730_1 /TAXON_ID=38269 /ORGANISM="Gloeochaete witrockiana, Strain SAG 46.84" /LENGTH=323 /DNA_ID=CAMNT_0027119023 /DNA_START=632 /DNA_END=1600 /DNA_ORIENTATION=-
MEIRRALGPVFVSIAILIVLLSLGADAATPKPTLKTTLKITLKATLKKTPSKKFSLKPSPKPSLKPSLKPSPKPSLKPSPKPSLKPSPKPSLKPSPKRSPSPISYDFAGFYVSYLSPVFVVPSVPASVLSFPGGFGSLSKIPNGNGQYYASISFYGLGSNPTSIQIRSGFPGSNGPIILSRSVVGAGTIYNATEVFVLTPAQVALLESSNLYVTVCTIKYPQGELRGQIVSPDKIFVTQEGLRGPADFPGTGIGYGVLINNIFSVGGFFYNLNTIQITSAKLLYGSSAIATLPLGSLSYAVPPYVSAYFGQSYIQLTASQIIW